MGWMASAWETEGWQGKPAVQGDYSTGLINYWPMDNLNVTGIQVTDTTIAANHGNSQGTVTSATGPTSGLPQGRGLPGTAGSYIGVGNSCFNYAGGGAFSFAGYVWVANNNPASVGGNRPTFFVDDNGATGTNYVRIMLDTSVGAGVLSVVATNSPSTPVGVATPVGTLDSGVTWKHFVFTYDGAGTRVLYINGSPVTTGAASGSAAGVVSLGSLDSVSGNFNGRMAGWRIYNRRLSQADVTALFLAGL
jgi:hypothetical protein